MGDSISEGVAVDDEAPSGPAGDSGSETVAGRDLFPYVIVGAAIVGLVGRLLYTLILRDHPMWSDSLGYHFRAQDLADGNGFVLPARQVLGFAENPPDSQIPPLWTVVLATPTWLGMRSVLQQQLSIILIGTATIVMAGLAGRAVFGRRVGMIVAVIVAVYPNVWLYERELLSEPLVMFMVAVMIALSYRFLAGPSIRLAVALGLMGGLLALTRSEQALLLPLLVLPLIMGARGVAVRQRLGWLVAAGLVCLLVITPWTAYNWNRFEQPVVLSSGFGQALRAGNCERVYHGERLGYVDGRFYDVGEKGCSILDDEWASDQTLAMDQLRRAALDYMGDNLDRVPVVAAARVGRTFNVYRPFQQVHFEAERNTPLSVLRLGLVMYWGMVPLAVLGVVAARRRGIPVYPILVYFVVVTVAVAITIGAVRYRAPAELPLALLAAVGIDELARRSRRKRLGHRSQGPPAVAAEPVLESR